MAFLFIYKEGEDKWKVRYYFDLIQKESKTLTQSIFLTFLENIKKSLFETVHPQLNGKQEYITMQFALHKEQKETNSYLPFLKSNDLKLICSYLSKEDILSLSMTNKHIRQLIQYALHRDRKELFGNETSSKSSDSPPPQMTTNHPSAFHESSSQSNPMLPESSYSYENEQNILKEQDSQRERDREMSMGNYMSNEINQPMVMNNQNQFSMNMGINMNMPMNVSMNQSMNSSMPMEMKSKS